MKRLLSLAVVSLFVTTALFAQPFGSAVAVSGNEVIAGGRTNSLAPGFLYRYRVQDDGSWLEVGSISASDAEGAGDGFGRSVALSGEDMVVGAPLAGKVYFFSKNADGSWSEIGQFSSEVDGFGSRVSVSGGAAIVAAPGGRKSMGAVFAYRRDDSGSWVENGTLSVEGMEEGSGFGSALAIGRDQAAVGAPRANKSMGSVYTFYFDSDAGKWTSTGQITNKAITEGSSFGSSLLIAEGHMAVGVPGYENRVGAVNIFVLDEESGEWSYSERVSPFAASGGEQFGSALAFSGSQLWVGAPGWNGRTGAIFRFTPSEELQKLGSTTLLQGVNLSKRSSFGGSIAVNDRVAVVGATGFDNRSGAAIPMLLTDDGIFQGAPFYRDPAGYASVTGGMVECGEDKAGAFPCKEVNMESFLNMQDLGADRGVRTNDIWGWEDPATGREYALVGLSNQTSFVDVTDPVNPVYLGKLPMTSTATSSVWRDIKVYKDHAFIVSDGAGEHGMQVFDLHDLRDVENAPVVFEEAAHYGGIFSSHNIVINEDTGFAYAVGSRQGGETCGGGLHMINIEDPTNPTFAGCFTDGSSGRRGTGYSHDAQCVVYHGPDTDYRGHEICLGSNETALSIADVTDKDNPVSIAIAAYPKVAYAHQGWLTDDHRYFYMNDEGDEGSGMVEGTRTLVWDLSDLDEPELVAEHIATTTETDHNLYVRGNLMYQSNYGAGFRVLDISNPESPVEVAYFDTSPVGGSGGSWSNYPYFKSGTIIVTGGSNGLFILKKKNPDI